MEIIGIGIDIVEIYRIRAVHERFGRRFEERIYTSAERERLGRLKDPAHYLSGRWAVKEAIMKVLGTGLSGGISWQDFNILRLPSGAPAVELSGRAAARARELGIERVLVSITHGKDHAVAQAIGIGRLPAGFAADS